MGTVGGMAVRRNCAALASQFGAKVPRSGRSYTTRRAGLGCSGGAWSSFHTDLVPSGFATLGGYLSKLASEGPRGGTAIARVSQRRAGIYSCRRASMGSSSAAALAG